MDPRRRIVLLDKALSIERNTIRTNFRISVVVFFAGIVGAVLVHILGKELGAAKVALTICTGFGSFLSGIPIKDTASKRLKIEALTYLKAEYEEFERTGTANDEPRLAEIEKRFWTFFDKNL